MSNWYVLRTAPRGERKAIDGITRHGHVAFCPTETRVVRASRHAKRKRVVAYPLTPRYIAAQLGNPYDAVHAVDEITGVVSTAGQTALRNGDLDRLRHMDGANTEIVISKSTFTTGQAIIVREGPFRDHPGTIDSIDGGKARISVQLFGRPTPVEIPLECLDPG